MFGFGKSEPGGRIPTQFPMQITRKTATGGLLQFNAFVSGYFVGKGSKAAFSITTIAADRMPDIDIKSFSPSEIAEIERYATRVEYKKLIGCH